MVVYQVQGKSMEPSYKVGVKVLVQKKWFFCKLKVNDVIVLHDPRNGKLIMKRISEIKNIPHFFIFFSLRFTLHALPLNNYFILGDNAKESTDSREFGWVDTSQVIGKVCFFNHTE